MSSDPSPYGLTAADVAAGFAQLLGRPPENEAVVAHYLSMRLRRDEFFDTLLASGEFAERQRKRAALAMLREAGDSWPASSGERRVLLFGAYGNGNLGDAVQAEALAWLLRQMLPQPLAMAASSWERQQPYHVPGVALLTSDTMLRSDRLTPGHDGAARLVVIGGGGLLGAPHFPLHHAAWARWFVGRGVPYALLGIGGATAALEEPDWSEAYRTLLQGAVYVGGRDAATLAALRAIRPDAAWFPDPVLTWVLAHVAPLEVSRPIDLLLIPRFPNSDADAECSRAMLARRAAARPGERVVVASLEPHLDAQSLQGEDVEYLRSWAALTALCRQSRRVVTLRLHGAVAGIAAGCVVHGLVQPKIGALMHDLGVGAWFDPQAWRDHDESGFHAALAPGLLAFERRAGVAMRQAGLALQSAIA